MRQEQSIFEKTFFDLDASKFDQGFHKPLKSIMVTKDKEIMSICEKIELKTSDTHGDEQLVFLHADQNEFLNLYENHKENYIFYVLIPSSFSLFAPSSDLVPPQSSHHFGPFKLTPSSSGYLALEYDHNNMRHESHKVFDLQKCK